MIQSAPDPSAPIGVFDSGLGGLRVLDRLMLSLPEERFVYLGDTAHMPYGPKPHEEVLAYVEDALSWLVNEHQVKMVVVACNTAAAVASAAFEPYAHLPFVDPVTPICRWLNDENRYRKVGVMATNGTVAANRYQRLLDEMGSSVALKQIPCGDLASIIEAGETETKACDQMLRKYVAPLTAWQAEAVVLGCTHYPYVGDRIANLLPTGVDVLDPSTFMALEAKRLLKEHHLAHPQKSGRRMADVDYFVTAEPQRFYTVSQAYPFQAVAIKEPRIVALERSHSVSTGP